MNRVDIVSSGTEPIATHILLWNIIIMMTVWVHVGCEDESILESDSSMMNQFENHEMTSPDAPLDASVFSDMNLTLDSQWQNREYPHILDHWPLNAVQVLATHNSYHIQPRPDALDDWRYTHPSLEQQLLMGVRQIELDLHAHLDGFYEVYHLPIIDEETHCRLFITCLQTILDWSTQNSYHLPITVLIELKDLIDAYKITDEQALDQVILSIWPSDKIITPDEIRAEAPTLRTALNQNGWPPIAQLRGRIMFVLLNQDHHHDAYLGEQSDVVNRLLFIRGGAERDYGSIVEWGDPRNHESDLAQAYYGNYLIRVKADDPIQNISERSLQREVVLTQSYAHWINSDFINADYNDVWQKALDLLPRCVPAYCEVQ
jgi:hypothetical protein